MPEQTEHLPDYLKDVSDAERCRLASVSSRQDAAVRVAGRPVRATRRPRARDSELVRHCGNRTDPSWFLG